MALPFFYKEDITTSSTAIILDEQTSKHVVQVLRMQNGEQLQLTNGKGDLFTCEITDDNRKKCVVKVMTTDHRPQTTADTPRTKNNITIAISLIKNNSRFEWFLEKATEIGVNEIIPLICERTEKNAFKFERMNSILISAMLQSQQYWLPKLQQPQPFNHLTTQPFTNYNKYIAHCEDEGIKQTLNPIAIGSKLICIGPEGDFTKAEIDLALQNNFIPVSLGNTRLRTETAGIVAATLLVNSSL